MKKEILSVTRLTEKIKSLLEGGLGAFWVEGEISNLRKPGSGHLYFTLKDDQSQVRAVIFRLTAALLRFRIEDGMHIVCRARLNVYQARGEYQLIVDVAEPLGAGALQVAFEQLKARLGGEGLFDAVHKKPIPFLPRRIGVITSPSGAVIRDILNVTRRRFESVDILIAPVKVQGPEAPMEIVGAISALHSCQRIDVIILARGGGSLEDLAAFNDEAVARAIFAAEIPIISAVGHEVDFTISDFISDLRAPTPSAAAELAIPLRNELCERVDKFKRRMYIAHKRILANASLDLAGMARRLKDPRRRIADLRIGLEDRLQQLKASLVRHMAIRHLGAENLGARLLRASPASSIRDMRRSVQRHRIDLAGLVRHRLGDARHRLGSSAALLDTLSPLAVLERGYAIAWTEPGGKLIRDAGFVAAGDGIRVKVAKGEVLARVEATKGEHEKGKI